MGMCRELLTILNVLEDIEMIIIKVYLGDRLIEKEKFNSNITGDLKSQKWLRKISKEYRREPRHKTERDWENWIIEGPLKFKVVITHDPPNVAPQMSASVQNWRSKTQKAPAVYEPVADDDLPF
jgi:hypothetical protein